MENGTIIHYLNGLQVEEPFGWRNFTEEFDRDVKERLISVKYQAQLVFAGQGYQIINDLYNSSGFCATLTYEAKQWCEGSLVTCAKGEIIIADCEFNETRCEVKVSVADQGVGARVVNNKGIPVSPTAESTKNGFDLTPVTPINLEVFDPQAASGTYIGTTRRVWDWWDAIQNVVLYMTDNQVYATSDWYNALPDDERYCFVDGNELRVADGSNPRLTYSFSTLFTELAIKYNLWIGCVRDVSGNPVLRIEPEGTFFGTLGNAQIANIQDLIRSIDTDRLYAKVSVGSDTYIKALQTGFSLPFLVLRGFTKEEFHFEGVCNTNETLDLVNEWVIDTNVIEDVVVNGNQDHDNEMFLIQYDRNTNKATKGDYLQPGYGPYLYNERLQNFDVLNRYDIPSPVGAFWSPIDASFRATRIAATNTPITETAYAGGVEPELQVQFDNDYSPPNFDTTNNYGNGTTQGNPVSQANSRYTAPVQGYYEFTTQVNWRIISQTSLVIGGLHHYKSIRVTVNLNHFNAANVPIGTPDSNTSPYNYALGPYVTGMVTGRAMDVGDYMTVTYVFEHSDFQYIPGNIIIGPANPSHGSQQVTFSLISDSVFATTFVTGGGSVQGGGQSRVLKYEFDRHIDLATWRSMTNTPEDIITIGGGAAATIPTHALNAKRNVATGATSWAVIKKPEVQ